MRAFILILVCLFFANVLIGQNNFRQNAIVVESNFILSLSFSYDRVVPVGEKMAITLGSDYLMGVGFGYGSHWLAPEAGLIFFGPTHFLETGVMYAFQIGADGSADEEDSENSPGLRLAYRYQTKKGLTLRATANFFFNIDPVFIPALGVGYSF